MTAPPPGTERVTNALGDELRRVRLAMPGRSGRAMSQEQLARVLLVGGKGVVSLFESGGRVPPPEVIDRYGELPGTDVVALHSLRLQKVAATTAIETVAGLDERSGSDVTDGQQPTRASGDAELVGPLRRVGLPSRRLALLTGIAFVAGGAVTGTTAVMAERTPSPPPGAVEILGPVGDVDAKARFTGRAGGLVGAEIWLDVQSIAEQHHHPTDSPCDREGDTFSMAELYLGRQEDRGVVFRITAFAVSPDSNADRALRAYAARDKTTPDAYDGLLELPAGIQSLAVGYVKRR